LIANLSFAFLFAVYGSLERVVFRSRLDNARFVRNRDEQGFVITLTFQRFMFRFFESVKKVFENDDAFVSIPNKGRIAVVKMLNQRQNLYRLFYFIVVLTLIALTFTIIPYIEAIHEGRKIGFRSIAVSNFVRFYLWGALFPLIFVITRKFGFESSYYSRNFLIHLVLGVLISILHFTGYTVVSWLLDPVFQERFPALSPYLLKSFLGSLSLGLPFYALIVFAVQAYLSHLHSAAVEKRTSQLQSELVQAQLQALKMQLQPHFLFNTLNSISSLVLTDPPLAYSMIAKLGDFLRLTLDYNEDQMVLLSEELQFLRAYLEIEQTRFSDRLQVRFDIENEVLRAVVPHLVLQPIVENSIKHAIGKRSANGVIEIKAGKVEGKLRLQVKDNGPGISPKMENTQENEKNGTGLLNIQKRLNHIYGNASGFEMSNGKSGGMNVTIFIPLEFDLAALLTKLNKR
jgi:sensor histidine kinase YesM